jgi:hypothetical protein
MTDADSVRMELLVDDHHGIYIPQNFVQGWAHAFTYPDDPQRYADDVRILAAGPHPPDDADDEAQHRYHEAYDEAWTYMLDNAVGRKRLALRSDGPDAYTWPDIDTPSWGTPNPWAGWRIDASSGWDGCVRTYHPDDAERIFGDDY